MKNYFTTLSFYCLSFVSISLSVFSSHAMDGHRTDPFEQARQLYLTGNYVQAKEAYEELFNSVQNKETFGAILQGNVSDPALIQLYCRAKINYGDCLLGLGNVSAGIQVSSMWKNLRDGEPHNIPAITEDKNGNWVITPAKPKESIGDTIIGGFVLPWFKQETKSNVTVAVQPMLKALFSAPETEQRKWVNDVVGTDSAVPKEAIKQIGLWDAIAQFLQNQQDPIQPQLWMSAGPASQAPELQAIIAACRNENNIPIGFWTDGASNADITIFGGDRVINRNIPRDVMFAELTRLSAVVKSATGKKILPVWLSIGKFLDYDTALGIQEPFEKGEKINGQKAPLLGTLALMEEITKRGGLIGMDTSVLMLALANQGCKDPDKAGPSCFAALPNPCDTRWSGVGQDGKVNLWNGRLIFPNARAFKPTDGSINSALKQAMTGLEQRILALHSVKAS